MIVLRKDKFNVVMASRNIRTYLSLRVWGHRRVNVRAYPVGSNPQLHYTAERFHLMLWAIVALLLVMGLVGLLTSSELVGGVIQIILICALVALGIHRILRAKKVD